MPRCD